MTEAQLAELIPARVRPGLVKSRAAERGRDGPMSCAGCW